MRFGFKWFIRIFSWISCSVKEGRLKFFVLTHYSVWLRTGRPGFNPQQVQRIFPLVSASRPALGPTQPPVQWVPGALSPGVKRGRGLMLTTHPLPVPRLRKSRSYTSCHQNAPLWSVTGPLTLSEVNMMCVCNTDLLSFGLPYVQHSRSIWLYCRWSDRKPGLPKQLFCSISPPQQQKIRSHIMLCAH
jgi:hypothetical protein